MVAVPFEHSPPSPLLAPPPDFRYVGLEPGPRMRAGLVAGLLGATATLGAGMVYGFGSRGLLMTAIATGGAAFFMRRAAGPGMRVASARSVPMAIVPWGILVEPDREHHVLRWPAVEQVNVHMIHSTDQGTSSTLWSVVTVDTRLGRLSGRARGAVPLERLSAHVERYAEEASHVAALDLQGEQPGEGPLEPEFEPLLAAARAYILGAPASSRLGLAPGGYRMATSGTASPRATEELRRILHDRTPRPADPRAFAAVLAAELHARELVPDLLALVQCPHPLTAAVAKVAAKKLGGASTRAGALDEVAPFLMQRDVEALAAWEKE